MADDEFFIKLFQKFREDISREFHELRTELRTELRATNARIDVTNGRLEALTEMTMARFTTVENALLDLSARTHVMSGQLQRATARDDVKARLTTLEET